jgi:hypothetical protein
MAITRLTDIITVFDSKWTYGDVKFGYDGEVNQDHDTQYPLMLVTPPESIIPAIYNGREEYSFEINFYNLYSQAAQSVVTLQKRWDNLQDLSNEWLDLVLKNYQDVTVEAYLNDESIEIERIKDVKNDKLVQIKIVFTMSAFTKCFRPVSIYPSDFANLTVWISADSNVTFNIATKKISSIIGRADNTAVVQNTDANQPLWYGYDGNNDKSYLKFNGTTNFLSSTKTLPVINDFTVFEVSKNSAINSTLFSYISSSARIDIKLIGTGAFGAFIYDGSESLLLDTGKDNISESHISVVKKSSKTLDLKYYTSNPTKNFTGTITNSSFNAAKEFNEQVFAIGGFYNQTSGITSQYFNGEVQEFIVYNRALSDSEIDDVQGYLNLKYKIY